MSEITFSTGELNDIELALINVLLTQAKRDRVLVVRACKYVIERLELPSEAR